MALRQVVYLLMAMVVFSAPLAACTLPGLAMSEEESECCHHMADECGNSQMEASHSCCTKTPPATVQTLQPTIKHSPLPAVWLNHVVLGAELPRIRGLFAVV